MSNYQKSNFARTAHFCPFLCSCFAQLQRETYWNFLVTRFIFFSLPLIFILHWWPLAFLILSPPLSLEENSNKKMSSLFFISRSRSLSPYFSLSFAGLPPTFSFSLSFSCSIFQICGHDSYSELNTLENTDTETISPFRLFSCLCFTRRGWLCELHLGCHTCLLSYFTLVCLWCGRTVVRSVGVRSRDYQILLDG